MDADSVSKAIELFARQLSDSAMVLAAAGTVTMALLELIKGVVDARMRFNKWRLEKWIPDVHFPGARGELYALATGDVASSAKHRALYGFVTGEIERGDVLYDQPLEKMMGQIQAAANMALDFPQVYEQFYKFLVGARSDQALSDDAEKWRAYAQAVASGKDMPAADARFATQARARIGNLTARKLDGFQNEAQYLWAELNQRVAIASAALFLGYALWPGPGTSAVQAVHIVILSFFGGLVAPFAKDLVSSLSGLSARTK
jgi:hypothetical protein